MKTYTALTVPSMAEINKLKKKYTAISLFSGCGGSSTGHKLAGFDVLYANEFIPAAQDTYRANHVKTFLDDRDVRTVEAKDILKKIGLKKGELDLMDASPPCSAFSTAGKREEGWGETKKYSDDAEQRVDDLFFEFVRLLKGIMPKVFVAENVDGLIKGVARGYFVEIFNALQACGYRVEARVINASYLGVPQARKRLIFVGVRNDLNMDPVYPRPRKRALTIREVLPNVRYIKTKSQGMLTYVPSTVPSPTITASDGLTSETAGFSCGGFVEDKSGARRKYTIRELRKVFGYPEDFKLTGTFEQRWERLGRSVPPLMMYAISRTVLEKILDPYHASLK